MQNPIQTMLRLEIFKVFFQEINFFTVLTPCTAQVRKVKSAKNHFLVIFYSAKSISDHLTISDLFQVFSKNCFFSLFRTLYCKGGKHEVRKKSFLVLFYSAKSISDKFTIWELFQVLFQNANFFHCFEPYTAKVRSMRSEKNHF